MSCICLVPLPFTCSAQAPNFLSYGISAGLDRPDVSCVFQDSRHTLWVGTDGAGIYTFSQARCSQQVPPSESGYKLRMITEDDAGRILWLSESGIARYDGRHVELMVPAGDQIDGFTVTPDNIWWLGGDSLYQRNENGRVNSRPVEATMIASQCDNSCDVFVAGSGGLMFFSSSLEVNDAIMVFTPDGPWISSTEYGKNTYLVSADGELLSLYGSRPIRGQTGLRSVTDIAAGTIGSLWISGQFGISVFQSTDSLLIPIYSQGPVNCIYFDLDNRLWAGSPTEGLLRYFGEQYRTWDIPDGIGFAQFCAGKSLRETLFVSKTNQLHYVIDPGLRFRKPADEVHDVYSDVRNTLWGVGESALWMLGDTGWIAMDTGEIYQHTQIIGSDQMTNLWMDDGEVYWHYGVVPGSVKPGIRFARRIVGGSLPTDKLVKVLTDRQFRTFRIGEKSIGQIEGNHFTQSHLLGFSALSADIDSSGVLWIGTEAAGIFRLSPEKGSAPQPVTSSYPLRTADIVFLKRYPQFILAGTDHNVVRLHTDNTGMKVTKAEVLNASTGPFPNRLYPEDFTLTADGHLLVHTTDEILEFEVSGHDVVDDPPYVGIDRVLVNGVDIRDLSYAACLGPFNVQRRVPELSPGDNSIAFQFFGNTAEDEHLSYSWRLRGNMDEWSAPSLINRAQFNDLSPGHYALEVRVCDDSGNCGIMKAPWVFTIRPATWHKWWFWLILLIILIVILTGILRGRTRRMQQENAREKKRLVAELNALTHEQKSLQLQMNPHFIFNALQKVRSKINDDSLDDARQSLTQFSRLMRMMLEMGRSEKITLEEELEFLTAYTDVEKMTHHFPVRVDIEVSDAIEPHELTIPPMLIQPIVENAIKYGGDGKEIRVQLNISLDGNLLHVSVDDNGKGYGSHSPGHKSAALEILRNRLMRLGKGGGVAISESALGGASVRLDIPV